MTSDYSLSDIQAVTRNNEDNGWGGNNAWWIIILFVIAAFGWGGFGGGFGGFGGGGAGAQNNYVLASDFATIQRQLSDGFGGVEKGIDTIRNGLCDGFYTEAQLVNGVNMNMMQGFNSLGAQLADCCCKTQSGIERINTNNAMNTATIQYAIKDCCCENEKIAMQSRFDAQTYNCNTLQAIDKLGDRIEARLNDAEKQRLIDENNALRLAANNQVLFDRLRPCPSPAYITCNPWASSAPYGACGTYGACG